MQNAECFCDYTLHPSDCFHVDTETGQCGLISNHEYALRWSLCTISASRWMSTFPFGYQILVFSFFGVNPQQLHYPSESWVCVM